MKDKYDIFISYKRKSLVIAKDLYERLTTRGYSTFLDKEEMHCGKFEPQLYNYIENANDVFIIMEEGSLDACKQNNWENDWFCKEIAHALNTKRNIIPIHVEGYKMPESKLLPEQLKGLLSLQSPDFISDIDLYLDRLIKKSFIISNAAQLSSILLKADMNCKVSCSEGATGAVYDLYKNRLVSVGFYYRTREPIVFKFTVDGIRYFKTLTIESDEYHFLKSIDVNLLEDYEKNRNIDRYYRASVGKKYNIDNEDILHSIPNINIHWFNKILMRLRIR